MKKTLCILALALSLCAITTYSFAGSGACTQCSCKAYTPGSTACGTKGCGHSDKYHK